MQAVAVGVQPGNTFTYKVKSASGAYELDGADNFTITVVNVTGSVVGFQEAVKYSNGTSSSYSGLIDLGNGSNTGVAWLLFNANLSVGDPVYPGWPIWANTTLNINGRTMGHTVLNNAYVNIPGSLKGNLTADVYCDQATGAAYNATVNLTDGNASSFSYYLIYTNAWIQVPEFSPITLIIAMSTLTVAIAAIAHRKKTRLAR